jgi:hypothetical protein
MGSRGIAPDIHNLDTGWKREVCFTFRPLDHRERVLSTHWIADPHSRYGCCEEEKIPTSDGTQIPIPLSSNHCTA